MWFDNYFEHLFFSSSSCVVLSYQPTTTFQVKHKKFSILTGYIYSLSYHYQQCSCLVREEVLNISKLVVNHKGQHTHLGGTSLVELDSTLGHLGLLIESVPAKVEGVVTEVTNELSSGDVLHDSKLKESNEGKNLKGSGNRNSEGSIPAVSKVGELGSGVVNVTREVDSGGVDEVSDNSKHTDTSVLDLDVTETVELLLVTIGNKSERIEESKRRLGSELVFEGLDGGGLGGLLGRGEGGGSGEEGGEDGKLHLNLELWT
mmetsp:Transcript_21255/g.36283  ORF Transcript_21255/g.36283 Transcript_21255/m.36283 type:complete len:260 (-) Transcript_21255:3-782(-)